ncbi:hypothetical protein SAY86_010489 [Trapa natans]|uniref:Uncharacterized protein n=1 Tax=Trapa natans TaxID=22666 RepID=A0AAN7LI46_TRANT|nr:hypothetical protein SAY86_010489 [Trapa natans]
MKLPAAMKMGLLEAGKGDAWKAQKNAVSNEICDSSQLAKQTFLLLMIGTSGIQGGRASPRAQCVYDNPLNFIMKEGHLELH